MKKKISIDGFTLRRPDRQLGGLNSAIDTKPKVQSLDGLDHIDKKAKLPNGFQTHINSNNGLEIKDTEEEGRDLSRSDISDTLDQIGDKPDLVPKLTRRQRRRIKRNAKAANHKKRSRVLRIIKWVIIALFLGGLGFIVYTGIKFFSASSNIFNGNIFQAFQNQPLIQDINGRSNFLILGTSEDDPGHEGANLADSIIVVSIDQTNHNAYTFSVPRDLYVEYGEACVPGYSGKINAYFFCANDGQEAADEQERLTKMQKLVGDIFGIDIHYGVHVNYTVVKQAVDAVGGIDVDIQGSGGAPGVMDRHFDYQCDYKCYLVKYDNGVHHLDGQQALNLARVRGDEAPTYGLARSNFDREINQQKIIIALLDKAVSTGTLSNFNKVMKLIDAFGNNLRSNIQTNQIRTLIDIAMKTKTSDINMISLVGDNEDPSVLTTNNDVFPSEGIFKYDAIKKYIAKKLSSDPVTREAAPIVVLNGSGTAGLGQTKADELKALGYNITLVDTAPEGTYAPVEIYQIGTDSAGTAKKLASLYDVTLKTTKPPVNVNGDVRFVIIYGPTAVTQAQ